MTTKTFVRVSALFWLALIPFLAVATSPSEREIMAAQAAQEYLQKYGTHFLRDMERNGRFIVEVNPENPRFGTIYMATARDEWALEVLFEGNEAYAFQGSRSSASGWYFLTGHRAPLQLTQAMEDSQSTRLAREAIRTQGTPWNSVTGEFTAPSHNPQLLITAAGYSRAVDDPSRHSDAAKFRIEVYEIWNSDMLLVRLFRGYRGRRPIATWMAEHRNMEHYLGSGRAVVYPGIGAVRTNDQEGLFGIAFTQDRGTIGGIHGKRAHVSLVVTDANGNDRLRIEDGHAVMRGTSRWCARMLGRNPNNSD